MGVIVMGQDVFDLFLDVHGLQIVLQTRELLARMLVKQYELSSPKSPSSSANKKTCIWVVYGIALLTFMERLTCNSWWVLVINEATQLLLF